MGFSILVAQVVQENMQSVGSMQIKDAFVYVVVAGLVLVIGWLNTGRRVQQRINDGELRIRELTTQVFKLQDENLKCTREAGELKIEVRRREAEMTDLYRRITALESQVGLSVGSPRIGVIIANLKGIIRAFSPTLSPVFRYLPEEVVGKPITFLMPTDVAQRHAPKFTALVGDPARHVDKTKVILSYGRDKLGNKIPLAIQLDDWQEGTEGFITATVRERVVGARIPSSQPGGEPIGSSAFGPGEGRGGERE